MSTTVSIECISWLIKVTNNDDARWKLEIKPNHGTSEYKAAKLSTTFRHLIWGSFQCKVFILTFTTMGQIMVAIKVTAFQPGNKFLTAIPKKEYSSGAG
jgi:hypothetical protein